MPQVGPTHSVSVAAAVVDGSGAACLRSVGETTGAGSRLGGVLELDETIGEGLVREVLEEIGSPSSPRRSPGSTRTCGVGIVALVFRCHVVDGQAGASAEAAKAAWLSAEEVAQRMDEAGQETARRLDGQAHLRFERMTALKSLPAGFDD